MRKIASDFLFALGAAWSFIAFVVMVLVKILAMVGLTVAGILALPVAVLSFCDFPSKVMDIVVGVPLTVISITIVVAAWYALVKHWARKAEARKREAITCERILYVGYNDK